jgi:copper chaperone CopZ
LQVCTILDALEREPGANTVRPEAERSKAMKQVTLKIEGMHCEGCAQVIEALLGREEGVQKVAVSYAKREARLLLDPDATDLEKLAAAIGRAGYRVVEDDA